MISAFGIEHGEEVSKGTLPWQIVRAPRNVRVPGKKKRLTGAQIRTMNPNPGPSRTERVKGAVTRAVETPISVKGIGEAAGRAAGASTKAVEAHPAITGGALVGTTGAAGYYGLRRKPKKS